MTETEKELRATVEAQERRIKYLEAENKGLEIAKGNLEREFRKVWSYGR